MNILLITEFFPNSNSDTFTGGVEARTYYIHKYLRKSHNIKVISRNRNQVTANIFSIFPRLFFQLSAIIRAFSVPAQVIEGSNFTSYLPAWIAAKLKGIPAIAWFADVYRDIWFENFSLIPAFTGWLMEKVALKLPWNHIIAMSNSTKNKLIKAGVNKDRISIVYGGVDHNKLKSLNAKKYPYPTISTISRLVNYKRTSDLISAVGEVARTVPDIKLHIIGDGPEKNNLLKMVKEQKLSPNVKFFGTLPHNQALRELKKSHLFSLASLVEGFGLVTVEAMAAGVPYINSDISPTREITYHGKGGLLFSPKNSKDLSKKIIYLLKNKDIYQKKQLEGLKLAEIYDWKNITNQTLEVYKKAVKSF